MTFVYPLFLWALAAMSIPVIIHLFNFRKYKKVYFTNVKFLRELQIESQSKSRLRELLILIARCLMITCLVLAFSQPILPGEQDGKVQRGARAVSIYIDNSFSMENVNRQGPLLDIAKTRAREVINAFDNGDRFQVITNDFEGKHQRLYTREDALGLLGDIRISPAVRPFSEVLRRQQDFVKSAAAPHKKIYAFSDAQRSTFDLANCRPDTGIVTTILPLDANAINNVVVDSAWFEAPLQQKGTVQNLHARIVNHGKKTIDNGTAKLFMNERQTAISSYSLSPEETTEVMFSFVCTEKGFNYGSVRIEDYPITFDDELFFAFNPMLNVAVCVVTGRDKDPAAFASLFKSDSLFKYTLMNEQTIDYGAFSISDVIVLNQLSALSSGFVSELVKFTAHGGAIVVIPSVTTGLSYQAALSDLGLPALGALDTTVLRTEGIEHASRFYQGVFEKVEERVNLPIVNRHYKLIKGQRSDFESILSLQNGDVFFGYTTMNNALVYLFSAPLEQGATNFNKHALFVPTFYQVCFSSLRPASLFYLAGDNATIGLRNEQAQEQPPHIKQRDNKQGEAMDVIPEARLVNNSMLLYTRHQVTRPGFYTVTRADSALMPLAFNYSRRESDLARYEAAELTDLIEEKGWKQVKLLADDQDDISARVIEAAEGKKLWKLFIFLALVFIGIEAILLRLFK